MLLIERTIVDEDLFLIRYLTTPRHILLRHCYQDGDFNVLLNCLYKSIWLNIAIVQWFIVSGL